MATHARQQYFADENSLSKERREFSIADEIQEKIDSVEEGAQVNRIETVKVNGTALTPDANKAVNVEVPDVIDNLYSTSTDDALSAKQGKVLYDYIQNIASRGRFLSNWNCATGLPVTNPTENPYPYKAGDYYSVSNVASGGGTNYRPDGSSYTIGQASTVTETEEVNVSDFYLYDGTNWLLLVNTARQIAVDSSLSTTSTNPVENRVVTNAINGKQNTLTAGNHIDITSDVISTTGLQEELTAGNNITISSGCTTESDMKGPCPSGYHIPWNGEWGDLLEIFRDLNLSGSSSMKTYFKLPFAGSRSDYDASITLQGGRGWYRTCTSNSAEANCFFFRGNSISVSSTRNCSYGNSIRPFKNTSEVPDSSWTTLYDGSSVAAGAGIFHNATLGLISASSDGTNWMTIADKNLGATQVYNDGDVLSEANCGGYFQRGNNYMFPFTGAVTTSSTQVDANGYGPGNYYSDDTFITGSGWDSSSNVNLWGGQTQSTWQNCETVISAVDTTYTAGRGINIDANNEISNIQPGPIVSSTAPSDPIEGDLWYDTTNDELKVYDGSQWNKVGGSDIEYVTQAEYNALLPGAESDGKHYFIYTPSVVPVNPIPQNGLIGYYSFENDTNNDTVIHDESGLGNNGVRDATYGEIVTGGKVGTYCLYKNTDGKTPASVSRTVTFDYSSATGVSFMGWIKTVNSAYCCGLGGFFDWQSPYVNQRSIALRGDNNITLLVGNNSGGEGLEVNNAANRDGGVWTHYAVTFGSNGVNNTVKIYRNGIEVYTQDTNYFYSGTSPFYFISLTSGRGNAGYCDDVAVYNRVLTASEISDYYTTTA